MRIHRRFLYFGVFFIAMGGVMLAADYYGVDETRLDDLIRLWPLALVAIGAALVLSRTRFNVAGGLIAAAIPGLVLGAVFVAGAGFNFGCSGIAGQPTNFTSHQGTFNGPAGVDVNLRCGTLNVDQASGSDWHLDTGNTEGNQAVVDSTSGALSIQTADYQGFNFRLGHDLWRLSLPAANPVDLTVKLNAGEGNVTLGSTQLRTLSLQTNAGTLRTDATDASIQRLEAKVNAGSSRIQLPDADYTATVSVNAGDLRLCAPGSLGVRVVNSNVSLGSANYVGLLQTGGGSWETANYSSATHKVDLSVAVNLGSFTLNPFGGC